MCFTISIILIRVINKLNYQSASLPISSIEPRQGVLVKIYVLSFFILSSLINSKTQFKTPILHALSRGGGAIGTTEMRKMR